MRYRELTEEWDEYAIIAGDVILRNPSPTELDFLLKQSHYGAVRLGFNHNADLLIWSADNLSHSAVEEKIGLATSYGFSVTRVPVAFWDKKPYKIWADEEGYSEKDWEMVRQNAHIKRLFRNKDVYDPSAAAEVHSAFL